MGFIVVKKAQRTAFPKQSGGLLNKAKELSTLCVVDVYLFIIGDCFSLIYKRENLQNFEEKVQVIKKEITRTLF